MEALKMPYTTKVYQEYSFRNMQNNQFSKDSKKAASTHRVIRDY